MKSKDRKLIRTFYQSLVAPERALFLKAMDSSKEDRIEYLTSLLGKEITMDEDTQKAILSVATLTKQDRILIFSGMVRQLIFKLLGL